MYDALHQLDEPVVSSDGRPLNGWAWVGLGTNVGDRWQNLRHAVDGLGSGVRLIAPIYETEPWGVTDQPWFLNTVVLLRWDADAPSLLERCKRVESSVGRVRRVRNGPREIDLDVLVLGDLQCASPRLTVPHRGIASRRSVLEPWADVAASLVVPGLTASLGELRHGLRDAEGQAVRCLSDAWTTRWER